MLFSKPFSRKILIDAVLAWAVPLEQRLAERPGNVATVQLDRKFESVSKAREQGLFNLGRGGFFVATDGKAELEKDKLVSFRLQFGSEMTLEGLGHVRWTRRTSGVDKLPTGSGVEFAYLADGVRERLLDILRKNPITPFIPRV